VKRRSRRLRTRRAWLYAAVVPALLLRALIPAGFMPVAAAGGVAIDFCPGDGAMRPHMRMTQPHAHAESGPAHHSGGAPRPPHPAPCLFAASATLAGAPASSALHLSATAATASALTAFAPVFSPSIVRAQSPRAPPVHA
jgi:hypothetical protein